MDAFGWQVTQHAASVDSTSAVMLTLLKGGEIERSLLFCDTVVGAGQKPLNTVWELLAEGTYIFLYVRMHACAPLYPQPKP